MDPHSGPRGSRLSARTVAFELAVGRESNMRTRVGKDVDESHVVTEIQVGSAMASK